MTANWIVAERLILPIRVIKLGDKDRPATQEDISDVSQQITNVANDPNLTLVTHHAFSYDWHGASGKIHNISNDLEFVSKEILDGLMLNQAILSGEMQGYASAQVGVEILLKRLESWRLKLTKWIEKHIFLPVAMMQGFKDEQKSELLNRPVYLYPKIEWEDLNLRDKTNMRNQLMQLYDKQLISAQKLLESFDIDYDQMTEERRQEAIVTGAMGQIMGMPGGGMGGLGGGLGGGMPMGGGMPPMGGGLGGDLGGGLGGDLGGGLGDMGGMPPAGGMPGGGMAGGEMGQAAASIPSNFKITKKGKSKQQEQEQEQRSPQYKTIPLTSLEQKLYKKLATMKIPYPLFGQYKVGVPGENQPFVIDFAYPHLGVGLEADGAKWHENLEDKSKNMERDHKLASLGWRVLRFNENAINQQMDEIEKIVYQHIHDAAQDKKKKKADSDKVIKIASSEGLQSEKIVVYKETIPNNIGVVYYIGLR
jgi:very-short-patch-repair endonuclease